MDLFSEELMYQFQVKDLGAKEALRQFADHLVKQIKAEAGWDTDVHLSIQPGVKGDQLYSVSLSVFGLSDPIVVRKQGRHVLNVMRKVRKAGLRQIHRLVQKKIVQRRKQFF